MLLLVMILTSINSILALDPFWTMTRGGPGRPTTVFSWMGYAYAFQFFRFGEGAAILYVLTVVCLILAAIYLFLLFSTGRRGRFVEERAGLPLAPTLLVRTTERVAVQSSRLAKIIAPM